MEFQPVISIIIVNHNARDFLKRCLQSIFEKISDVVFEVWVVDNASSDGSIEMIRQEFPEVKIIANKENVGFAKANNQAIQKSEGKYIFLLNPDAVLLDSNLKELINFMEQNDEVGMCGPLIVNRDGSMQRQCKRGLPTLWNSVSYYLGLWKLFPTNKWWRKTFGGYFLLAKPDDQICEVDCLSGAAMIVRNETIKEIGLMCEDYIMYMDDIDWCYRAKKAGWKVYYVPLMKVMHYGGVGGSQLHVYKNIYYFYHSAYLFYKRYLASQYNFVINFVYYVGLLLAFVLKIVINLFRKEKIIGSKK